MSEKRVKFVERIKSNFLDREKYVRTVRIATFIILCIVGAGMTVLNVLTPGIGLHGESFILTYTTGIFSILALINALITLGGKKCMKFASACFAIELLAMFAIFIVNGAPQGFSAIWICLLPLASMIFYGRKIGSILSAIMFLVLILFFWIKIQNFAILQPIFNENSPLRFYDGYTETFCKRFPILYFSFFLICLLLQFIQDYQFTVLKNVNDLNESYSTHDQLTGLFNRKGFYNTLDKKVTEKPYSKVGFVIFDLDHFKKLNDTFGHVAGDQVLVDFANLITTYLPNSISCRWGGEEFLVCYFDEDIMKNDLEKFRQNVQNFEFKHNDNIMRTTVSGGVFETNDKNLDNKLVWLNKADEALYKAKESGRNKVIYY